VNTVRERWKAVVDFEDRYQVSNLGRVRSVDRYLPVLTRWGTVVDRLFRGKLLAQTLDKDGYFRVGLYAVPVFKLALVHRLVAQAFIPNLEGLPQVDHKNGVKTDNHRRNLQWVTGPENTKLAAARGHLMRGERHVLAALTEEDVRTIRLRAAEGETYTSLSAEFGVTDVAIRCAALRITWKHVQ